MKKIYTVAVLGCGNRGFGYSGYMCNKKDQFKLVSFCDINPAQLRKMENLVCVSEKDIYTDTDEFFKEKRADIVVIATPDRLHVPHAIRALELGYDILLEKPISDSRQELYALAEAQKKYGGKIIICHVLRYAPAFVKCFELLKEGAIGKLYAIDASERVAYWHWAQAYVKGMWANMELAHPAILAKCSHDLDLLTSYADSECDTVSSIGSLEFFKAENTPEGAADRCFECVHLDTCPYSAKRIYIDAWHEAGEPEFEWPFSKISLIKPTTEKNLSEGIKTHDFGKCAFKQKVDMIDNQMIQMTFKNGIKASLKMVFASSSGRRIAFYGTYGEMILDEREDEITVVPFGGEKKVYKISELIVGEFGHGGGDSALINELYDMIVSDADAKTSLDRSIECHLMGIAAEESRHNGGKVVKVHG